MKTQDDDYCIHPDNHSVIDNENGRMANVRKISIAKFRKLSTQMFDAPSPIKVSLKYSGGMSHKSIHEHSVNKDRTPKKHSNTHLKYKAKKKISSSFQNHLDRIGSN